MTDLAWIDAALTSARPQAMGALLRYFRDLDTADLFTEISRGIDKWLWFVEAHLQADR